MQTYFLKFCSCVFFIPFSGSSLFRRLRRSCREKSRDTEIRPSSWSIDKDSSGNSSNFLSASNTTYVPRSSGNLTHTYKVQSLFFTYSLYSICKVKSIWPNLALKGNVLYESRVIMLCALVNLYHIKFYSNSICWRGMRFSVREQKLADRLPISRQKSQQMLGIVVHVIHRTDNHRSPVDITDPHEATYNIMYL